MAVNYQRRLQRYFDQHYSQYEETAEWFPDGAPNKWKFIVPELGVIVTLVCGAKGDISETVRKRQAPEVNCFIPRS